HCGSRVLSQYLSPPRGGLLPAANHPAPDEEPRRRVWRSQRDRSLRTSLLLFSRARRSLACSKTRRVTKTPCDEIAKSLPLRPKSDARRRPHRHHRATPPPCRESDRTAADSSS